MIRNIIDKRTKPDVWERIDAHIDVATSAQVHDSMRSVSVAAAIMWATAHRRPVDLILTDAERPARTMPPRPRDLTTGERTMLEARTRIAHTQADRALRVVRKEKEKV